MCTHLGNSPRLGPKIQEEFQFPNLKSFLNFKNLKKSVSYFSSKKKVAFTSVRFLKFQTWSSST
jgi:hypothetical protein